MEIGIESLVVFGSLTALSRTAENSLCQFPLLQVEIENIYKLFYVHNKYKTDHLKHASLRILAIHSL